MLQWLDNVAGPGYVAAILWTFAALILLVVVLLVIKVVRNLTFGTFVAGGRNRKTRLAVMDATAVDSHRRLVLVRRDDIEQGRLYRKRLGGGMRQAGVLAAAGLIALRPDRDGVIAGYEGVDDVHRRFGDFIIDQHLPPPGTPTQPVEAGYMANAWMRLRHPDYDELRGMLDFVGRTAKVRAR